MKSVILYHSADYDGYFSAVVTAVGLCIKDMRETNKPFYKSWVDVKDWIDLNVMYVGFNYDKTTIEKIENTIFEMEDLESLYSVDITICDKDFYQKLLTDNPKVNLIFLDHHETSYDYMKEAIRKIPLEYHPRIDFKSINSSDNKDHPEWFISSAEMVYNYFAKLLEVDVPAPKTIVLASTYDSWNKERFNWYEETLAYQYGIRAIEDVNFKNIKDSVFTNRMYDFFATWFINYYLDSTEDVKYMYSIKTRDEIFCNDQIKIGKNILSYIVERNKKVIKANGKNVYLKIHGNNGDVREFPNCFIAIDNCNSSQLFEDGLENCESYDLLLLGRPIISNKHEMSISIISSNHNSTVSEKDQISSGELCELLGGGGHNGIGGCIAYYEISDTAIECADGVERYILDLYQGSK